MAYEAFMAGADKIKGLVADRAGEHGDFLNNMRIAAEIARCITGTYLSPMDVTAVLVAVKLARMRERDLVGNPDNILDAAAYLLLMLEFPEPDEGK